jgi:hypothetical protein
MITAEKRRQGCNLKEKHKQNSCSSKNVNSTAAARATFLSYKREKKYAYKDLCQCYELGFSEQFVTAFIFDVAHAIHY